MNNYPEIRKFRRATVLAVSICLFTSLTGIHQTLAVPQEDPLILQANTAITMAQSALATAETKTFQSAAHLADLQAFSSLTDPDINSLENMRKLTDTVSRMFDGVTNKKFQDELTDAEDKLVNAKNKLKDANTALANGTTPEILAAKTRVQNNLNAVLSRLDAEGKKAPELQKSAGELNKAIAAVYESVKTLATNTNNRLTPFTPANIPDAVLLDLFENSLSDVPSLIQFDLEFQNSWKQLSELLTKVGGNDPGGATAQAVKDLHDSVTTIATKISSQLDTVSTYTRDEIGAMRIKMDNFASSPRAFERDATQAIKEGLRLVAVLDKANRLVGSISAQAQVSGIPNFNRVGTQTSQDALSKNVEDLRLATADFQELLSGDRSLWVTEKIRLYYFTDIPRLVQTLNSTAKLVGGDADARRRAQERLDRLRAAEDAQSAANGAVAGLKKRVTAIRQQLQAANDQLNAANILARTAASRDAELNRRPEGSVSAEEKARSAEEKQQREDERKAAQQRADALNDQHNGLAAQLTAAEHDLEIAQEAFERASSTTIRAAQDESAAFAYQRDNAPFWATTAVATSNDPAKRVEITSSTGGENAIFVRGRKEDVASVQDIVAKLDEPAPQARMTLWKIELNSDATQKGAEKFNNALAIVEEELANTRAKIADTLSMLLGAVSAEAEFASTTSKIGQSIQRKDCHERNLYAQYFRPDPRAAAVSPTETDITGRYQRLKRYSLYSEQVRKELGIEFIDELGFDNPKQFGLKDPGSATTLNEALIVLLLTDRSHRESIMKNFQEGLKKFDDPKKREPTRFTRLEAMLQDQPQRSAKETETTRQQQELIYAMRGPLLRHLITRIAGLQDRVKQFTELYGKQTGMTGSNGTAVAAAHSLTPEEGELYRCLQLKLPRIFDTIHDEFPISAFDIMNRHVKLVVPGEGMIGLETRAGTRVFNLRPSPARVAAADGMLDIYTKAFEDDIDREFVRPMLANLRARLKKSGIGFGVIQRTSMLATNRLMARVDPRATAELSVGQETNLLQGLQSIAQITLAAQTGNVLGGLSQLRASANEKDAAEIYGITSGSAFQVTPIFDPTGQALRFKFDFVDTTLVREPRGTVNPRLPRIERHTVNTEVQLANMEIREVSRFESDSKIGLPTTYWGGLPLLKDLPGVRPIPLIGWFVRRKGSNAIAQRSLIFAQTTMSPTIGDILNLFDTSLQRR